MSKYSHPGNGVSIDAESLAGMRFPYQEDRSLVEDIDLMAATPGEDINWLEDIQLLVEDGVPAVFDRYTNAFIKIYFDIPEGREERIEWLYGWWERVDDWIEEHRTESPTP